ncbi:SCO family protein [Uliginosibacterium paludis]|uniref:SCO family protein n=1 Tax=Uliginosibacterium paludis TaxID=1615952 RepID=A0ABV2CV56_9RHOO
MQPDRRRIIAAACGLALLGLTGCQRGPRFNTTDISGSDMGAALRLTDHHGRPRTMADFAGKAVVVFFGYTNCPDVCPTSLMMLKEALAALGPDASRVQVLFVSVDPARDTPQQLGAYMQAFDPGFLALSGSDAEIAAVAKAFKVFYEKKGDIAGGHYTIDHTAGCYIFGPDGRTRLFARHGETPERVAADLKLLLAGQ